jgi:hypothetical protein
MRRWMVCWAAAGLMMGCNPEATGDGTGDGGVPLEDLDDNNVPGDPGTRPSPPAGGGGGSGGAATVEAYFGAISQGLCAKMFECCPDGNEFIPNEQACQALFQGLMGETARTLIDQGKARYDAAAGATCLNVMGPAIAQLTCEGGVNPDTSQLQGAEACTNALVGLVEAGGSCKAEESEGGYTSSDIACAGDTVCVEGACAELVGLGQACTDDDLCGEAAYCPFGGEERVCTALKPDGAPCEDFDECLSDECGQDGTCEAAGGLSCGD